MDHGEAVTRHYLAAENSLDDGYWDSVYREEPYYEEQSCPHPPRPEEKGKCVGEFDVLLVNYDDNFAMYKELKTSRSDMYYAEEQVERAVEHFENEDWDIIGTTVLER